MFNRNWPSRSFFPASFVLICFFSLYSFGGGSSGEVRAESSKNQRVQKLVRDSWMNLGGTSHKCEGYDYFPDGGMRNFYCHLISFITYKDFSSLIGKSIFKSGPHSATGLVLDSKTSFGHYNKKFVKVLRRVLIPGAEDKAFRKATVAIYFAYVRSLARIYYVSYRKLHSNPGFMAKETKAYKQNISKGDFYDYERFYYFMNPLFYKNSDNPDSLMMKGGGGGWNGNVVKTAVAFWLRRGMDGTDKEFFKGLKKLLKTYDKPFLKNIGNDS